MNLQLVLVGVHQLPECLLVSGPCPGRQGASITNAERAKPGPSVAVGVVAALAILLILFGGAFLAALTPLVGAALALVIGSSAITLLSHALTVASASTDLAVPIGLGVGVDYGLFIVSRHRAAVRAGRSYSHAVAEAVNTSGRTVLFAGLTVCVALLGQFALGVGFSTACPPPPRSPWR